MSETVDEVEMRSEYYLLVDENNFDFFRIPAAEFEDWFELMENPKCKKTYRFNKKAKNEQRNNPYFSLDNYICSYSFHHMRSDWSVSDKSFIVKGVYFWHNNVYS